MTLEFFEWPIFGGGRARPKEEYDPVEQMQAQCIHAILEPTLSNFITECSCKRCGKKFNITRFYQQVNERLDALEKK